MKYIFTLLLLLLIQTLICAQDKIAVINFEKVINNSQVKFEFDYVSTEIDSFVTQLGREQVTVFQRNMEEIMKRYQSSCANLNQMREMEEDLKNQQKKLLGLEKFATDTLPLLRQKLDYEVRKIIQKEIEEYGKFSGIGFIGDINNLYFHVSDIKDISYPISFQLKQKYNLPQHKLARRQTIYNIKERYQLNQDLRKRFGYSIIKQNSR